MATLRCYLLELQDRTSFTSTKAERACKHLFAQARNKHHMELVEGHGNEFVDGRAREGDAINRVYVLDSDELPFNQAEVRQRPIDQAPCNAGSALHSWFAGYR